MTRAVALSDGLSAVVAIVAGLLLAWALLVGALYVAGRRSGEKASLKEALRLLPDVVVLVRRLAGDRSLPRGIRWRLVLLLAYLVSPIDLVPDFIPVIGYADDLVIVAFALRSVTRAAGEDALGRLWPGTPEGLGAVRRLAGLPAG